MYVGGGADGDRFSLVFFNQKHIKMQVNVGDVALADTVYIVGLVNVFNCV